MKRIMLFLLMVFPSALIANPYFRLIDPKHIQRGAGVFVDPIDAGNSSVGSEIALITHSPKDGCLFPTIVCEDWSPFTVGSSVNAGRYIFTIGPSINVTPLMKAGLLAALNKATDGAEGLKAALALSPETSSVTLSISPSMALRPIAHGVILPLNAWGQHLVIFVGPAWKF